MNQVVLKINNLNNQEKNKLKNNLLKNNNIKEVLLLNKSRIKIKYQNITIEEIEENIENLGYTSLGVDNRENIKSINYLLLIILGIIFIFTLYITLAITYKLPTINIFNNNIKRIILIITSTIFIILSKDIIMDGIKKLIKLKPNINTLVTINSIILYSYGIINKNNYYYLEVMMFILYFQLLKIYIYNKKQKEIAKEIKQISRTKSKRVRKLIDNKPLEVNIEDIKEKDIIMCYPKEKVLFDGIIIKGSSSIDESLLTGNSKPSIKKENDYILAGSTNLKNEIIYQVKSNINNSYTSKIKKIICNLQNNKIDKPNYLDKYSSILLPILILLIVLSIIISYILTNDLDKSIKVGINILVLLSPISLLYSEILPFERIKKYYLNKGIIIKKDTSLEELLKIDTVIFDKTGTLTYGYLNISEIKNFTNINTQEILEIIAGIVKNSTTSTAINIMKYIRREKINTKNDFFIEDLEEYGIKATDNEDIYYLGKEELLKKLVIENKYLKEVNDLYNKGEQVLFLIKNKKVIALIGLKDMPRKESKKLINILKEENKDIVLVTGDIENTTKELSKEIGINTNYYQKGPIDKLNIVSKYQNNNHKVMMIGEGINDAPSLLKSDVGITLMGPMELPSFSSDIIINNNLLKINELKDVSKKLLKKVKTNILISIILNILLFIIILFIKEKYFLTVFIIGTIINYLIVFINSK